MRFLFDCFALRFFLWDRVSSLVWCVGEATAVSVTTEVPGSDNVMIGVSLDRPEVLGCGSLVVVTTSIVPEVPGRGSFRSTRFIVGRDWGVIEEVNPVLVETTTGMLSGCDEASFVLIDILSACGEACPVLELSSLVTVKRATRGGNSAMAGPGEEDVMLEDFNVSRMRVQHFLTTKGEG